MIPSSSVRILCSLIVIFLFSSCDLATNRDTNNIDFPKKESILNHQVADSLQLKTTKSFVKENGNDTVDYRVETDTIRILSFFGHETSPLPKKQVYWKVVNTENGLFKRERIKLDDVASASMNHAVLRSHKDEQIEFIYTGLADCDEVINADDSKKNLQNGDSILIQENVEMNVYLHYKNDRIRVAIHKADIATNKATIIDLKDFSENNEYIGPITVHWIGDIDCDNINEVIVANEIGNTFFRWTLKSKGNNDYYVADSEKLYWD